MLRAFTIIAIPLVITLALYLYWLTLPGYEPTGNEVYDAFAPVAYEYQQFDNAFVKIDKPLTEYLSHLKANSRWSRFLRRVQSGIYDFGRPEVMPENFQERFSGNLDYCCLKYVFERDDESYAQLLKSIGNVYCDEGICMLVLDSSKTLFNKESCRNIVDFASTEYPRYACWYHSFVFCAALTPLINLSSFKYPKGSEEYNDAVASLLEARKYMDKSLSAPINVAPTVFPFDTAIKNVSVDNPRINRRIALWMIGKSRVFSTLYSVRGMEDVLCAYRLGAIDYDFIDDYSQYIKRFIEMEEPDRLTGRQMQFDEYIAFYDGITRDVVGLTGEQNIKYKEFRKRLMQIKQYCDSETAQVEKLMPTPELGYYASIETYLRNAKYISSELSKLSPPTIEEWLADGASLKPVGTQQTSKP